LDQHLILTPDDGAKEEECLLIDFSFEYDRQDAAASNQKGGILIDFEIYLQEETNEHPTNDKQKEEDLIGSSGPAAAANNFLSPPIFVAIAEEEKDSPGNAYVVLFVVLLPITSLHLLFLQLLQKKK
jgi:hypothetical protein